MQSQKLDSDVSWQQGRDIPWPHASGIERVGGDLEA